MRPGARRAGARQDAETFGRDHGDLRNRARAHGGGPGAYLVADHIGNPSGFYESRMPVGGSLLEAHRADAILRGAAASMKRPDSLSAVCGRRRFPVATQESLPAARIAERSR